MDLTSRAATSRAVGIALALVLTVAAVALAIVNLSEAAATRPDETSRPPGGSEPAPSSDIDSDDAVRTTELDPSSRSYGPTDLECPADAIRITDGQSPATIVEEAGTDNVVCFTAGRHRLSETLRPQRGMTLLFESGAVLDGSVPVNAWEFDGDHWVADGQLQHFEPADVPCEQNPAACAYEDLFVDGQPLTRVMEFDDLRPGTFYFDKPGDKIHIADDPAGHLVEATTTETAIDAGGVQDVTIRNATIEKFAKHGIVTSDGWTVANNEIRYVHSHGLRAFGATRVLGNDIHHAGNMAIFAEGDGLVFEDNQLAYNNYLGFDLWHAGATKITESADTVVRNNWSHHNNGDGWWFDWNNAGAIVEGNVFEHNSRYGLFYEASFDVRVSGNAFVHNGSLNDTGGGLWISTSKNVEITHNEFDRNRTWGLAVVSTDRGVSQEYGVRETTNLDVHDNTFVLSDGHIGVPFGSTDIYGPEANNRFAGNDYAVSDTAAQWWRWGRPDADEHQSYDWAEWNAAGQDLDGSISAAGSRSLE